MPDKLVLIDRHYKWRIEWLLEDGDRGATLGEGGQVFTEEDLRIDPESWEHILATMVAAKSPNVEVDGQGFYWEWKEDAVCTLKMVRAQLRDKSKKPWPKWALEAKAAGWSPPKGWTP